MDTAGVSKGSTVGASDIVVISVFLALLIEATYRNLRTGLIHDVITLPGIVIGLVLNAILLHRFWACALGALVGFGITFLVSEIYYRRTGREGMGFGVVKLAAMVGAFLGVVGVCIALGAAFASALAFVAIAKPRTRTVQFAPLLLIGSLVFIGLRGFGIM